MPMAVKLDESLSDLIGDVLKASGYEVRSVRGQSWSGTKDSLLWPMVQAERVFFITADKGFGDMRTYPPANTRACSCSERTPRAPLHIET